MFSQQQIYDFFNYQAEVPPLFGSFHFMVVLLTVLGSILACYAFKDASERSVRWFLFFAWIVLLLLEAYRQISYSISINNGVIQFDYNWGQMSLQICSVQLYAIPLIAILKDGRLRNALICVMMVWSMIGGTAVTVYPGETWTKVLGVTIQTTVHHSLQVILGVMLTVRYAKRMSKKHFIGGFLLFMVYFTIAMFANLHAYEFLGESINMFNLSPYCDPYVEIMATIRELTNHWTMTFIFMSAFTLLAMILYWFEFRLTKSRREKAKIH